LSTGSVSVTHFSQSRKVRGGRHGKQLWLSFIDFKDAYDHLDRRALWNHLRSGIGVSDAFLSVVESMYDNDAYILQDGGKVTVRVNPSQGVTQGCPLSPLLFISDIGEWMQKPDELDLPMCVPLLLDS
jgi:hypothetical protein